MITDKEREVIENGANAFKAGQDASTNPHAKNDYYREVWHEGWRLARDTAMFKAMRQA